MPRRIATLCALAALVIIVAFVQSDQGQHTLDRIFGTAAHGEPLIDPNSGRIVTLETLRAEAEWRKETTERLRRLD